MTAALAGLTAAHFLRRHAHGGAPGRQAASLALGMSAAGAAALAAHGVSAGLAGGRSPGLSLLAGLPALVGQTLVLAMVLRKRGSRG